MSQAWYQIFLLPAHCWVYGRSLWRQTLVCQDWYTVLLLHHLKLSHPLIFSMQFLAKYGHYSRPRGSCEHTACLAYQKEVLPSYA